MNPFREVNWRPGLEERRRFAVSLIVGFPSVAMALMLVGRLRTAGWNFEGPLALGGAGAALGLLFLAAPQWARPFYVVWFAAACCVGFVVGHVALAGIYFLMVTPLGLVMRAMGRRSLTKGFDRNRTSYWLDAPPPDAPEKYFRQF
ncbi:MAG: hypothetical protein ABIQ12_02825 [Opitutaceae bacterium]